MKIAISLLLTGIMILLTTAGLAAQTKPKFEQPVLVTSAGQCADVTLAGMLCKKLNLNAKTNAMAKASDLSGIKTLMIVAGFSSKGLGAAGISREQELARVKDLIAAAKEKNIGIVMMHIGGKPRRGTQSDDFNKLASESAKLLLVVKGGDEDQFFTQIAAKGKIAIDVVGKIAEISQPLAAAFK
jgi:hypothetical protein